MPTVTRVVARNAAAEVRNGSRRTSATQTLEAPTFSKHGPKLEALAGPERSIVLCGVSTDCCVISTALAAADAGMRVRVVGDACAGVTPASHGAALAVMGGYAGQISITSVEEELARG